jgi:hypothetical protein
MLRQEELAFVKALSAVDFSPALFKEVRCALDSRRNKKSAVPARILCHHFQRRPQRPPTFVRPSHGEA